jgi:hypothetical protein
LSSKAVFCILKKRKAQSAHPWACNCYGFRPRAGPEICAFRWLRPSSCQLISYRVPSRLCQEATGVCFGCILTPSLSPSAAEYFHLVAPGPVLRRIPEKMHLKKRMFRLGA